MDARCWAPSQRYRILALAKLSFGMLILLGIPPRMEDLNHITNAQPHN